MSIGPFLGSLFSSLWQEVAGPQEPNAGPLVNVDGTPMLDCTVDVLGKPYGDVGPSPMDSASMFGSGLHGSDG